MCRSIKVLRKPGQFVTSHDVNSAALQFVRKISGFHKPSRANQKAFERAVLEVANASKRLLEALGSPVDCCGSGLEGPAPSAKWKRTAAYEAGRNDSSTKTALP
jgi:hypothetical protein